MGTICLKFAPTGIFAHVSAQSTSREIWFGFLSQTPKQATAKQIAKIPTKFIVVRILLKRKRKEEMPHGYLKHNKEAGRKGARGGSSYHRKPPSSKSGHRSKSSDLKNEIGTKIELSLRNSKGCKSVAKVPLRQTCLSSDFIVPLGLQTTKSKKQNMCMDSSSSECPICFEISPVLLLSNKCSWHDAACLKCLRRFYVTNAQKDVKNYPLCCFYPQCRRPIQTSQLEKHKILKPGIETFGHHRMIILQKAQSAKNARTVYCPTCDMPRVIRDQVLQKGDRMYSCQHCNFRYRVSPDYATLRTMQCIEGDRFGRNDGIARCPRASCGITLSKGDGCDHMTCPVCDYDFSWEKAVKDFGTMARPKDEDIYLWW